jgi:hypothetical protein
MSGSSTQPPTYQELLSEAYENNALAKLVIDSDYADRELEPFDGDDYEENQIDDPDAFNRFLGDRNKPDQVVIGTAPNDAQAGKATYAYDKQLRVFALNIDGRFRSNVIQTVTGGTLCTSNSAVSIAPASDASNFYFRLSRQYKNVYSVKVTSFEFPNVFYTFSNDRGNTSFNIVSLLDQKTATAYIADGNYTIDDLLTAIQSAVSGYVSDPVTGPRNGGPLLLPSMSGFQAYKNPTTGKVAFACTTSGFVITFPTTEDSPYSNGIGYNLGFLGTQIAADIGGPIVTTNVVSNPSTVTTTQKITTITESGTTTSTVVTETTTSSSTPVITYTNSTIADGFPDVIQDTYVYLKLNDYDLIKHQNADGSEFTAFMKIPLTVSKGAIQFDNNSLNTTAKEYVFPQPSNLQLIQISILDANGLVLNMQGANISMTLEVREVLQSGVYENLLQV